MKEIIKKQLDGVIKKEFNLKSFDYSIESQEKEGFGDYSSNIAFLLAKELKKSPREIAEVIVSKISNKKNQEISKMEIAGGGFINFFLSHDNYLKELNIILRDKSKYGSNNSGKNKKIQVEFISSNPTGPMTLGNGRGGFSGDTLSNILTKNGFNTKREFYVNDAGNQVKNILSKSIHKTLDLDFSLVEGEDVYGGDYISFVARKIKKQKGIDWIKNNFEKTGEMGAKIILEEFIKKDVKSLGIKFDRWFSEKSLYSEKLIDKMWKYIKAKNLIYENEGAYWLKTSKYGDEKDRVVRTSDGNFTYLMSDMAYAYERLSIRKFEKIIMFLGADHHGYVGRLKAIAEMLGHKDKIEPIIFQIVRLISNGQEVRMSKRKGTFITLKDAAEDLGLDAARYFFISKDFNNHIDIDLGIAKSQSNQNPIFYIQYASARISSVLEKVKKQASKKSDKENIEFDKYELSLIKKISQYPSLIKDLGNTYQAHRLAFYSWELAESFHKFYDNCRVIDDEREDFRLKIIKAAKIVLEDSLNLMGIKAKKKM